MKMQKKKKPKPSRCNPAIVNRILQLRGGAETCVNGSEVMTIGKDGTQLGGRSRGLSCTPVMCALQVRIAI